MLNHARTLLLNVDGDQAMPGGFPGEELIAPAFVAQALPTYLQQIRTRLFGSNPDRAMLNYRLRQFMTLLHATELENYVLALDSRISYLPFRQDLFAALVPTVRALTGTVGTTYLQGDPVAPDAPGRMYFQMTLEFDGEQAVVTQAAPCRQSWISDMPTVSGLTAPIALGDTGYALMVPAAGGSWQIDGYLRPAWDLGQIMASLHVIGEPVLLTLFGPDPQEPYRTFENLFQRHGQLDYQLGGLLLATIYRLDELQAGGSRGG